MRKIISNTINNSNLREKLHEIINDRRNQGDYIKNQISLIGSLSESMPHSIELIEEARLDNEDSWKYNCYRYAFGLKDKQIKPQYILQKIIVNAQFTLYLIENYLSEVTLNDIRDDDYVIYFDSVGPKHAGKIKREKIISKWGEFHLWAHGLDEIPSEYGDSAEFFRQLPNIYQIFNQWAEQELKSKLFNKSS